MSNFKKLNVILFAGLIFALRTGFLVSLFYMLTGGLSSWVFTQQVPGIEMLLFPMFFAFLFCSVPALIVLLTWTVFKEYRHLSFVHQEGRRVAILIALIVNLFPIVMAFDPEFKLLYLFNLAYSIPAVLITEKVFVNVTSKMKRIFTTSTGSVA